MRLKVGRRNPLGIKTRLYFYHNDVKIKMIFPIPQFTSGIFNVMFIMNYLLVLLCGKYLFVIFYYKSLYTSDNHNFQHRFVLFLCNIHKQVLQMSDYSHEVFINHLTLWQRQQWLTNVRFLYFVLSQFAPSRFKSVCK